MSEPSIKEDDLHAYIDNQLGAGRRLAVERYLDANPEAASRVAIFREQRDLLRAAFATHPGEVTPLQVSLAQIISERNRPRPRWWFFAASVAAALGAGLGAGWLLHAAQIPGRTQQAMALLQQEALTSHVVYAVDRGHPVEVAGSETLHLQQWLSKRLDRIVVVPDLSALGYWLIGGRLLATEHGGAAALLMYEDGVSHLRISLLLRPMASALQAPEVQIERGDVNGRAWIAHGMGVAVIAAAPAADIARLATQIDADLGTQG
jgi:anti-sigma factor RsiW